MNYSLLTVMLSDYRLERVASFLHGYSFISLAIDSGSQGWPAVLFCWHVFVCSVFVVPFTPCVVVPKSCSCCKINMISAQSSYFKFTWGSMTVWSWLSGPSVDGQFWLMKVLEQWRYRMAAQSSHLKFTRHRPRHQPSGPFCCRSVLIYGVIGTVEVHVVQ